MSWKPEVIPMGNNGKWARNGLTFATEEEARDSAADLAMRWTAVLEHRAVEVDEPVTHTYHQHKLKAVAE